MPLKSLLGRFGGDATTETENRPVSHVCESCGEEYFANPDVDIAECHTCGGVHVERV